MVPYLITDFLMISGVIAEQICEGNCCIFINFILKWLTSPSTDTVPNQPSRDVFSRKSGTKTFGLLWSIWLISV